MILHLQRRILQANQHETNSKPGKHNRTNYIYTYSELMARAFELRTFRVNVVQFYCVLCAVFVLFVLTFVFQLPQCTDWIMICEIEPI